MVTVFYYNEATGGWKKHYGRAQDLDLDSLPDKYKNVLLLVMASKLMGDGSRTAERIPLSAALSTPEVEVNVYNNLMYVVFDEKNSSSVNRGGDE